MRWERDEREPSVEAFPGIIDFLGYEPWPFPVTLGDALVAERRRRGLAVAHAAKLAGIDPGTWGRWERSEWKPTKLSLPAINAFLNCSAKERFPANVR